MNTLPAAQGFDLVAESMAGRIATTFPKSRSANYDAALNIAQQAEKYTEATVNKSLFHFAAFGTSRPQLVLALSLIRYLTGIKGFQVYAGGKVLQNPFKVDEVVSCFVEASASPDSRAHCQMVVHVDNLTENYRSQGMHGGSSGLDISDVLSGDTGQRIFPCRYLLLRGFTLQPNHPATTQSQITAAAVREGCDWCPMFKAEDFSVIKQ